MPTRDQRVGFQQYRCESQPVMDVSEKVMLCVQLGLGTNTDVSRLGTALVIDDCRVLITPLRQCIVPPPLAAVTATCPAPVQSVACLHGHESEVGIIPIK